MYAFILQKSKIFTSTACVANEYAIYAVSYTHLDVYKRQVNKVYKGMEEKINGQRKVEFFIFVNGLKNLILDI